MWKRRRLVQRSCAPGRWILTCSQNLALLESVSQSLAGRTTVYHLLPLAGPNYTLATGGTDGRW